MISEDQGVPIEHFYHPKNSQASKMNKFKNIPKTINSQYIENISKSKEFVRQFMDYLNNHLMEDYKILIDSKLVGLVEKWDENI